MSQIEDIKSQIKLNISDLIEADRKLFNPEGPNLQPWNGWDDTRLVSFISTFFVSLEKLTDNLYILDGLPVSWPETFRDQIQAIINSLNNVRQIPIDQISSQHHDVLNNINNFMSTLRSYSISETLLNKSTNHEATSKGSVVLEKVLENEAKVIEAIEKANNLLQANRALEEGEIERQAQSFNNLSIQYRRKRYFLWLIVGIALVLLALFCARTEYPLNLLHYVNVYEYVLLRVSFIVIPITIGIFCIAQFIHYRKLSEFYEDKYSSLLTMKGLMQSFTDFRPDIIKGAMQKIFAEFKEGGSNKFTETTLLKIIELMK